MNERLLQLWDLANTEFFFQKEDIKSIPEIYAQLIVKETLYLVDNAFDQREPPSTYVTLISEHFGVEK